MKRILYSILILITLSTKTASADSEDSFRCGPMGGKSLVQLGCTEDYVVRSCGEPQSKYSDDWIYDLGKGDFVYTLRSRRGRLASIDRGDRSRGRSSVSEPTPKQSKTSTPTNAPTIKDVDHVRVTAIDEDGVLRIDVSYLNRDRDELVFWGDGIAKCSCKVYHNKGNILHQIKGDLMGRASKDLNRYDQDFYFDIPFKHRSKGLRGIIECDIDTRLHLLHATDDFHID